MGGRRQPMSLRAPYDVQGAVQIHSMNQLRRPRPVVHRVKDLWRLTGHQG